MTRSEPVPTRPPPPPPELGAAGGGDGGGWGFVLLLGVVLVGLGLWMLTNLIDSVQLLALVIGATLVIGGLAAALGRDRPERGRAGEGRERSRRVDRLVGVLLVAAGAVVLVWPDITLWVLAVTGGLALVLGGLAQMVRAVADRHGPGWGLDLAAGVLSLVVGAVCLAWPEVTLVVLAGLFGLRAVVVGILAVAHGLQLRELRRQAA